MKVLMINGSPRKGSNCGIALTEMKKIFEEAGIECEEVVIGDKAIRGCIACHYCKREGKCVFNDEVNRLAPLFEEAEASWWQARFIMHPLILPLRRFLTGCFTALPSIRR